jgi:hypothetical protein
LPVGLWEVPTEAIQNEIQLTSVCILHIREAKVSQDYPLDHEFQLLKTNETVTMAARPKT